MWGEEKKERGKIKKGEGVKWGEDGRKEVRAGKERRVTNVITGSLKIEARRSQV